MVKSRADYQREYRERRKQRDSKFLESERQRVKRYKLHVDALGEKEKADVRERNRLYKRKSRDKKRNQNLQGYKASGQQLSENEQSGTNNETNFTPPLKVKLNFIPKKRNLKRSKALSFANSEKNQLKTEVSNLKKANAKLKKRNQRMMKARQKTCPNQQTGKDTVPNTPKSKAEAAIREMGLTPRKLKRNIKKKLIMAHAMFDEIKSSRVRNESQKKRRIIANIISGKIIKKYKCMEPMSKEVCMSRTVLNKVKSKFALAVSRRRKVFERQKLKKSVTDFFERDDVSVNMPGKSDCKKTNTGQNAEKKQIRVLTDYLANLYGKFMSENPDLKISKSVFCRLRPSHVLLTKLISRSTCLCSKHQNIAMKLKAMRSLGIDISPNPETVSRTISKEDMKQLLDDGLRAHDQVELDEWRRSEVDGKKKMKIMKVTMTAAEAELYIQKHYEEFLLHVERVKTQCSSIRELKKNLPENELVVQMDFAENWTCSNADEVQSAYWNSTAVTLHPVVIHFKKGEELAHKNIIYVSDVTSHNSTAVYAILQKLVPELRSLFPDMKMIHYWTDSPSSQYRNKYIFDLVLHHEELFNVKARWNYFEAGHGQGPCDGLGGVAKRQAAEACKQGKVNIQDAREFYNWACGQKKSIEFVFYSSEDYENASKELEQRNQKPVAGTMKLHAVFPKDGVLHIANVSCYCKKCLEGNPCNHWRKESETRDKKNLPSSDSRRGSQRSQEEQGQSKDKTKRAKKSEEAETGLDIAVNTNRCDSEIATIGMYVLVEYDQCIYPAMVMEVDEDESEALVSFMEPTKGKGESKLFKWPSKEDELWVKFEQFVHKIQEPIPCGKSKRQFQLHNEDYLNVLG